MAGRRARVRTGIQQPTNDQARASDVPRASPRKKRTSFGRSERRSSRKFDPNEDINYEVVDMLIEKTRESGPQGDAAPSQELLQEQEAVAAAHDEDDLESPPDDEAQEVLEPEAEVASEAAGPSGPPQSSIETLKLLKEGKRLDKENRAMSLFERQETAQRVEFGDGFGDTQPAPVIAVGKGKQPKRPPPKKRPPLDNSDDDEAFEREPRTSRIQEQRERAKRVRIVPNSSSAPTSQHHSARDDGSLFVTHEPEESASDFEAPEMTEEAPPSKAPASSTFSSQKQLARANTSALIRPKPRKARIGWTPEAESALIEYMGIYPQKYAQILQHDKVQGYGLLQDRTQVNLKDKVRNMAITMIKSGTGFRDGFEYVITPGSTIGQRLRNDGFDEWWPTET